MASMMSAQQPQSVFPKSHVGFDSITNQIEKKLLKRGFQFNVICVGTYHTVLLTMALATVIGTRKCSLLHPQARRDWARAR